MCFSVYLFGADAQTLRNRLVNDSGMASAIRQRLVRGGDAPEVIGRLCERISDVRSLNWPTPGEYLSVDAFLWMLDYAAEPITISRLHDIRDASDVVGIPLLAEMTAERGPLPLPDVSRLECNIGFLSSERLRELAKRGPPPCADPHLDVGTELTEVFASLADDNLGLYTIIVGAKLRSAAVNLHRAPMAVAAFPTRVLANMVVDSLMRGLDDSKEIESRLREIDRQLLDAAEDGDVDSVAASLEQGASVYAKRGDGYTAFLLALIEGHNAVCRRLLDAGARADATDAHGASAMHIAAAGGNVEGLELLLQLGLPIESRDRFGATPLIDAIINHEAEAADWLLARGADVNACDNDGRTGLHHAYATSLDYEDDDIPSPLIAVLEKYGADPIIKDNRGRTPKDFPIR